MVPRKQPLRNSRASRPRPGRRADRRRRRHARARRGGEHRAGRDVGMHQAAGSHGTQSTSALYMRSAMPEAAAGSRRAAQRTDRHEQEVFEVPQAISPMASDSGSWNSHGRQRRGRGIPRPAATGTARARRPIRIRSVMPSILSPLPRAPGDPSDRGSRPRLPPRRKRVLINCAAPRRSRAAITA